MQGPTSKISTTQLGQNTEAGPPAPPPSDYYFKENHPPIPNKQGNVVKTCKIQVLTFKITPAI